MTEALVLALAAAFVFINRKVVAGEASPSPESEIRVLATRTVERYGFNVTPAMLVRIAWIESAFNPLAVRAEPHINDASAGLMQTLLGTAQWLARDFTKYRAFGVPEFDALLDPEVSMYFGAAYLDWLSNYSGAPRAEEFIVRAYNGGPGGVTSPQTLRYFERYLFAKERFG